MNNYLPDNYNSLLDNKKTQEFIKYIKDKFELLLSQELNLTRVSAPIVVDKSSGFNDYLSGKEMPISFSLTNYDKTLEIVQSLAKWKRDALLSYDLKGLYTDMNALRPNEKLDNLHSLYVDQWDWEKVISKEERNIDYLKEIVKKIYSCLYKIHNELKNANPKLDNHLPEKITFITSQELLDKYPDKSPKEREYLITKELKAVFLIGIGSRLNNNQIHDDRAADYDDWSLNGDLLLYYDLLDCCFELSSMGIRVDDKSLLLQLKEKNELFKKDYTYHQNVINNVYPLTIGGGIGQSRLCMFLLRKVHIGEVQASYWPKKDKEKLKEKNINLL